MLHEGERVDALPFPRGAKCEQWLDAKEAWFIHNTLEKMTFTNVLKAILKSHHKNKRNVKKSNSKQSSRRADCSS